MECEEMKKTCEIILYVVLALLIISLVGCASEKPASDTIADNAITATTGLEQQLPSECKTAAVSTQFDVIRTEIRSTKAACQAEKDIITRDKLKWKISFWILAGVVMAYVLKKLTK